jgi:hypothetical protein
VETTVRGADPEAAVRERYSAAARAREAALCCPVDYDPRHLAVIPEEVLERDYGCGDPSRYVREGDTVLDLGSGGGKVRTSPSTSIGSTPTSRRIPRRPPPRSRPSSPSRHGCAGRRPWWPTPVSISWSPTAC